jgi:DNA-binding winged helix-turn-helix (wHTH) protein
VPNSFRIGEFHVEPPLYRVSGPAGTVRLEPKVMQVLLCLAEHGDQVVPKERLMRAVWSDTFVSDDVLTRAISELRRVFGDDVKHPRLIETIPEERLSVDGADPLQPSRGQWRRDSRGAGRGHRAGRRLC